MKIVEGYGSSAVLVELEGGDWGVGVVYDDGSFVGKTFATEVEARTYYAMTSAAMAAYFAKFGTANE